METKKERGKYIERICAGCGEKEEKYISGNYKTRCTQYKNCRLIKRRLSAKRLNEDFKKNPDWNIKKAEAVKNYWKENYEKARKINSGRTPWNYKADRSTLSKKNNRRDYAYHDWRKQVWVRDKFKCRLADNNCEGRIEAHHILGWELYPEYRYQTNNGITLCHAHHPRKRAEEKRLIPTFQELVSVSN